MEEAISDAAEEHPDATTKSSTGDSHRPLEDVEGGQAVSLWGGLVRACRGLHHQALAQLLARATTICPQAR